MEYLAQNHSVWQAEQCNNNPTGSNVRETGIMSNSLPVHYVVIMRQSVS